MKNQSHSNQPSGFALVVTLTLMVLLSILALGLLSLSSVALRSTRGGNDASIARANARTALAMAIGEMQRTMGDDRRITFPADQLTAPGSDGTTTEAAEGRSHWTGVYQAWEPDTTVDASAWSPRPDPLGDAEDGTKRFLGWLVSPPGLIQRDDAKGSYTLDDPVEIVGAGTAGDDSKNHVDVGKVPVMEDGELVGNMAWWVGDQGVKSSLSIKKPAAPTLAGDARLNMQSAPTGEFRNLEVGAGGVEPFKDSDFTDVRLAALTDFPQSELLIDAKANRPLAKQLFHDIAISTSGLMTNVRSGGFRKDLSMYLQNSDTTAQRDELAKDVLYTVPASNGAPDNKEPGINMEELAAYYKLHTQLINGAGTFTTGGNVPSSAKMLRFGADPLKTNPDPNDCRDDYFHFFKQPVPIAYDSFFSLEAEKVGTPATGEKQKYRLRIVLDPVVIMWNPLDVPVSISSASVPSVKFWTVPFNMKLEITGAPGNKNYTCPLQPALTTGDHNYMSIDLTIAGTPLVFRPGEVMMISQTSKVKFDASKRHSIPGGPGFSHANGYSIQLRGLIKEGGNDVMKNPIEVTEGQSINVTLERNQWSNGGFNRYSGLSEHSRYYSLMHNEIYLGRDRLDENDSSKKSLPIGGVFADWDLSKIRQTRDGVLRKSDTNGNKPDGQRLKATDSQFTGVIANFATPVKIDVDDIAKEKRSAFMISFRAKTNTGFDGISRGTSWLPRFNPKVFLHDFYDFSAEERDRLPFAVYALRVPDIRSFEPLSQNNGRAFFGGGWTPVDGQTAITSHSVPREPLISLAAFQHSMANGFLFQPPKITPVNGFGILNSRDPLNPQISHAIGNSAAPAVIASDKTQSIMTDGSGRPLADHSYLANRALWDDWFLSSIAPMTATTSLSGVSQKDLARGFFEGTRKLPNSRYYADLGGITANEAVNKIFNGNTPRVEAEDIVATLLRVDGMFNVNSTSIPAWISILSGLRDSTIAKRDGTGTTSTEKAGTGKTPVTGQLTPENLLAEDNSAQDPAPWVGRRELDDTQIGNLARAIVSEVRASGPFLSLSDFVNRRPGTDINLAVAGPIQRAIDRSTVTINDKYNSTKVTSTVANRFKFPEAEEKFMSRGIPGIVKQADILTPIAPFISVRSDSFIIRAYGEAVDSSNNVTARAWCEATIERGKDFVDPSDSPETELANLTKDANKEFGRRFRIRSFRWLQPDEV